MSTRIGIDTGGTFTDVVRLDGRKVRVHKLRSTPDDPSRAVLEGLAAVRRTPDEAVDLVHGTTVGLNAVLTGRLARTVFVTNRGCEDLIEIGRQERTDLYALEPSRPVPPVPRRMRVGVSCRRGAHGEVVEALRPEAVERAVAAVVRRQPQAVAIGLLHSPADARDEQRLARAMRRALPDVPITCSAELLPAFGEYERFSAAILNAAIAPVVGRYTRRIADGIGTGTMRLLRSSLGILPPAEAGEFPARAMFSGPAGGVLATAQVARRLGLDCAAAFDMGGTSADVCLVANGAAEVTADGRIGGLPLPLPTVPVHTVGCGGGSIAYRDAGGALRVGPESVGADPGPACYGKSDVPTVTDAHVALGHLGAHTLLDGAFPIDVDAAVRAIERLGRQLGMNAAATARGILEVADAAMARAMLVITAERAIDPAEVPLVAFGGAGGLHAASLCRMLGMPMAVLPPHPGAFSALGLALAGEATEAVVAMHEVVTGTGLRNLLASGKALLRETHRQFAAGTVTVGATARGRVTAKVRYRGQGASLTVPLTPRLASDFAAEHQRRFGFVTDSPLEMVQLTARVQVAPRAMPPSDVVRTGSRQGPGVMRRGPLSRAALHVIERCELPVGATIHGPAICEEPTATTLVPANFSLTVTPYGITIRKTG